MNGMSEAGTRREGNRKKGAWSKEEDEKLKRAVAELGDKNWVRIERMSGLARPAKNCRLRWFNYLRPNLKKDPFTQEEQDLIFDLHAQYGNAWSRIASKLPGRSDNDIKNFWHKKRHREDLPFPPTPNPKRHQNLSQLNIHSSPQPQIMHFNSSSSPTFPSCTLRTLPPTQPQTLANDSYLEIIDDLRKAQARVRLLKKKLRKLGLSNTNQTSTNCPQETHLDENSSRITEMTQNNPRRKDGIQESIMPTHSDSLDKGFQREEHVSVDEIFKMKNSDYSQCIPNWNLWDECSSTLLQELEGDLFGEYSQSSSLGKAGDESYGAEYLKCRWESNEWSAAAAVPITHHISLQTFGEPTNLCQSSFVQQQYHQPQHCSLNEFYREGEEETWKQDLEGLVADNFWVENDKFFLDRYDFTC